jgi:PGF-CTERM protein
MNTKEKSKRGKAIIGIAMAAIMLASVLVAMVPTVSAVSTGTNFNYIGAGVPAETVLVGQNVKFNTTEGNNWAGAVTVQKFEDGVWYYYDAPDSENKVYSVDWDPTLTLRATNGAGQNTSLAVKDPSVPLKFKVGEKEVSSITVQTSLRIDTGGINLFGLDKVDLEIIDPDGNKMTVNPINASQDFSNITAAFLKTYGTTDVSSQINTTGWTIGSYTFQIKTKSEYACGLSASSAVKDLTIVKGEIAISAEKTTCVEDEPIKLTVTGVEGRTILISTSDTAHTTFPGGSNDNPVSDSTDFQHTIDADGKRVYTVEFSDTGSYTITVTDTLNTPATDDDETDTVDITVTEKGVTFDMPTTVVIGEKLMVKGTSNTGDWVQIAVDDYICSELRKLVLDENGEFEKEIDTSTACNGAFSVPGSVRMKAFIGIAGDTLLSGDVSDYTDDGSIALLMTRGDLMAELSTKNVAQDDDFKISGTAKGSKEVEILIVSPKGSSGSMIDGGAAWPSGTNSLAGTSIYHSKATISTVDDTFSKKIDVGANVDTGSYIVVVITTGPDGRYGKTGYTKLVDGIADAALSQYYLKAKTQEDMLGIIDDVTALSDDLLWVGYVKVEAAYVTLDTIADVGIGEPLVATGTTNRKDGFTIVVTAKGPKELTPATVLVKNGTFNATFDTTDAPVGMYTVKADDGDGHTDEATVSIVTAVPTPVVVSPTPTPVVSATPPPVATPTPTPEETPTPTPEPPGFEAVFAIAGLLAVAYLVLRRRK